MLIVNMRLHPKAFKFKRYSVKMYKQSQNGYQLITQTDRHVHNKCSQCTYELEVRVTIKFIENNIFVL